MIKHLIAALALSVSVMGCDALEDTLNELGNGSSVHVSSIEPSRGVPGATIVVKGDGFGAKQPEQAAVYLSEVSAAITSWKNTEIQFTVPAVDPGLYILNVSIGDAASSSFEFEVLDNDADNDGLTDDQEAELGTNPNAPDSDGDGLNDGQEVEVGTDPLDADSDDDGLTDGEEVNITETDPNDLASPGLDADSDGDGLTNGEEIELGTALLSTDTDADGLDDYAEVTTHSTDPVDADSDTDGLTDGVEVNTYGFDPNDDGDPGLADDRDADGLTNYDEYYTYHSDPLDADTDNDGLDDGEEVNTYDTDPTDVDTDDDGLEDGIEVNDSNTDPNDENDPGLMSDYDNDGLLNVAEYYDLGLDPALEDTDGDDMADGIELMAGTDPHDAASTPDQHPYWDQSGADCDADEVCLEDGDGWYWDIGPQGQPDDVADFDNDQDDAFDDGWTMVVYDIDNDADWWSDANGTDLSPLQGFSDRAAKYPWFWYGNTGLRSRAEIYVPSDAAYFRKWEVLENTTDAEKTVEVWYYTDLGSDGSEEAFASSDGDGTLEESDNWIGSDDDPSDTEDGDPAMLHIFADDNSPLRPDADAYCDGNNTGVSGPELDDETEDVYFCYTVTIPAHGRVAFLAFHIVDDTLDQAVARVGSVATLTTEMLVGLTPEQLALVVNRSIP